MRPLLVLALALTGCPGGGLAGVAGAVKTTFDVIRQTRGVLCTSALDPLMGNPREDQPTWVPKDASTADAGD